MKKNLLLATLLLFGFSLSMAQGGRGANGGRGGNGVRGGNGGGQQDHHIHHGGGHHNGHHGGQQAAGMPMMTKDKMQRVIYRIQMKPYEAEKLAVAKRVASRHTLYAGQVKRIMRQFAYEDTKLQFAKFAYASTVNPHKYFVVHDAFAYRSSVNRLNRFIARGGQMNGGVRGQNGYYSGGGSSWHQGAGQGMTYSGNVTTSGTGMLCNTNDMPRIIDAIRAQSFESDKLIVAKQAIQGRMISSRQVKRIMKQFSFESTKLKFAKFAWFKVQDPNNYFLVNDAFSFSSSVRSLNHFIRQNS